MNNVNLVGRLTRKPELKYVGGSQLALAEFTLAVDRMTKDKENNTDFILIKVWDKEAENCAKYLDKGNLVGVNGQIRIEKYKNKNNESRSITSVVAHRIKFLDSRRSEDALGGNKYYESSKIFEEAGVKVDVEDVELPF